jgi:galactose mutarotase-like enzyme
MHLYGKSWTRRELEARVGRMEQIGGVRRFKGTEGNEADVEQIQVRTGAGLCYYVTPTKGLDISLAEFQGTPISWQSANGDVHPSYYNESGIGWLRSASGGLLMTCGLMQVGSPNEDEGESLGLHGRVHHTSAKQVSAVSEWSDDDLEMTVSGVVDETSIFGGQLRLSRQISSKLGVNEIVIRDEVRNMGFQRCPHMILYHFNFGFPLLSEETWILFKDTTVTARDVESPLTGVDEWQAPDANYSERVYYHQTRGKPEVEIVNPRFPAHLGTTQVKVSLIWSADTLSKLVQWKMPGAGTHVLGVEPSNCWVDGRRGERERDTLVYLEPGETVKYEIRLNIR